jgi:hypothetical protein
MNNDYLTKKLLLVLYLAAFVVGFWAGTKTEKTKLDASLERHTHTWSMWGAPYKEVRVFGIAYMQFRNCTTCGVSETRDIE